MGTNYIAPIWRMPRNANKDKLSNYSLDFNGSSQFIDLGTTPIVTGIFSISIWIKRNSTSVGDSIQTIIGKDGFTSNRVFNAYFQNIDGSISFWVSSTGAYNANHRVNTSTLIDDTDWHHIVLINNGNSVNNQIFIDGVEASYASQKPGVSTLHNNETVITSIGADSSSGTTYNFNGKIGPVSMFDYTLSIDQITYLYNLNNPMVPGAVNLAAPVAYYPLGDNSNPNSEPGYPNISVAADSVFNFNGSSSNFIELNSVQNLTGEFSISIWVKPAAFNSNQIILGNDAFDWIRLLTANQITFRINSGSGSSDENFDAVAGESLVPNVWQHLFFYRDSSNNIRVYRNGSLFSDDINTNSDTFKIGKIGSRTGVYYTGEISNVAIWNSDQSSEISNIYNSGVPATTYTNTPTAWYKLNQSANWEADTVGEWQIPDAVSSYPQSFDFDGSNYITYNRNTSISTSNVTISGWFNTDTTTLTRGIVGGGGNDGMVIWLVVGKLAYYHRTSAGWGPHMIYNVALNTNEWYHFAATWDESTNTRVLYLNGEAVLTNTTTTDLVWINNYGYLGRYSTSFFDGQLSNIQIHNSTLPATGANSIQTLYNNGVPLETAIDTSNLYAWWKLNNNEIFDGTNWSIKNQKYLPSFNSALSFDGISNQITLNSGFVATNEFTLSLWVNPSVFPASEVIGNGSSSSNWLRLSSATAIAFKIDNTTLAFIESAGNNLTLNAWQHLLITRDALNNVTIYRNGVTFGASTSNSNTYTTSTIGYRGSKYFNGQLSNIAYWNSDQTSEKDNIYNNGTPATSYTNTPNNWYKLDNTTTGIQDSAGSNNGTNNGASEIDTYVSTQSGISSGMTEQSLVNNNVSVLNGESSGMDTTNLVQSNLTRTQPFSNYSMFYDAVNVYSTFNSSISVTATDSYSWSFWVKPVYNGITSMVIARTNPTSQTSDGTIRIQYSAGSVWKPFLDNGSGNFTTPSVMTDNEWNHIACSITPSGDRFWYINGVQQATDNGVIGKAQSWLGFSSESNTNDFEGYLSQCAYWDTNLSTTELAALYNNGVPQDLRNFSIQPTQYWPMNQDYSYWDGSVWINRDIISGNDSTTVNTAVISAFVGNAPGSEANGSGVNLTIADLQGNMYNSDKNAYSINMADYADGVTNPANSGRSTDTP